MRMTPEMFVIIQRVRLRSCALYSHSASGNKYNVRYKGILLMIRHDASHYTLYY